MCVLVDGRVQKELANGEVHVPFNKEYVLRFRNKNNRRAVVKFWIDGELVSGDGGYVIPANDYIDIKRHHNRDASFILVPLDSGEAVDAGKNGPNYDKQKGVVRAEFSLEKEYVRHQYVPKPYPSIKRDWDDYYYPQTERKWLYQPNDPTYGSFCVGGAVEPTSMNASLGNLSASNAEVSTCQAKSTSVRSLNLEKSVSDGCTVEGAATGQMFDTVYFDAESTSTTMQIFLRGFDEGYEFPQKVEVKKRPSRKVDEENRRLKQEIENLKRQKKLEEENARLKQELEELKAG